MPLLKYCESRLEVGLSILLFFLTFSLVAQRNDSIQTSEGVIHYRTFGKGTPILIINGGPGMNSNGFEQPAKKLSSSHTTILYDQRGTGKSKLSEINESSITLNLMVRDIETLRKHLGYKEWIIFGHSFGGMLGAYYTSQYPEKVKALILSSSGGINMDLFEELNIQSRLTEVEYDSLNYWSFQIRYGDTSYHALYNRGRYLAPAYLYDKSNVPQVAHRLTQGNREINGLVLQNMTEMNFDCTEELIGFKKPVLIIQGREDLVPLSIAEHTANTFSNSSMVILDKCGHYGWLDNPVLYFEAIETFLSQL